MAQLNITNISVCNNPSTIIDPFRFQITFQCFKPIHGNLDWKIIYLTSTNDTNSDIVIDQFSMNDLQAGVMEFNTESNPPSFSKLNLNDILGSSALLICACYEGQQFFRAGYYVINELEGVNIQNQGQQSLQGEIKLDMIKRTIVADNPRIMRFQIQWAKHEGNSNFNQRLLQQNLQAIGGDPFQQSFGNVFEKLDGMMANNKVNSYHTMMFKQ